MHLAAHTRIYLAVGATDLRKAIDGLSILVADRLALDPLSGHLFVFCNRRRNMIKILYWDRKGFCLWQKRLERHVFAWPKGSEQVIGLDARQLSWLLEGLDIATLAGHESLAYSTVI
jgi:transposase